MRALDISNYTNLGLGPLTLADAQRWCADGYRLVIIQAFPPSYADKYAEQLQQTAVCQQAGMLTANYIYDYLTDPTWRNGALQGIAQATTGGLQEPAFVAADEEDVSPPARALSVKKRLAAVLATIKAIAATGYLVVLYTGGWFVVGYLGNTTVISAMGVPLWDSNYDGIANPSIGFVPYGGWTAPLLKQYWGTSTVDGVTNVDLDVEAAAE